LQRLKRDTESARLPVATNAEDSAGGKLGLGWKVLIPAALVAAAFAAVSYFYFHRPPKLTDKDTIVLADFTNTTGDAVFDGTLRQGLAVQLEQSPFLSLVSDDSIQQTLRLMGQASDARLTPEIARDLCQRTGSKAVIDGSIAQIGVPYSLILKAVNCSNGELLTSTEAQASDKNNVLAALGKAASEIRDKLGESIGSVQKFDTPLEQATTPSLEALQAYSLGRSIMNRGDSDPVPYFRRAIELDPNFALAYATLGFSISGSSRTLAVEYLRKAYELRERVSQKEKLYVEAHYSDTVLGDSEKARQVYELWAHTYPRDWIPHSNLAMYSFPALAQYDRALDESLQVVRISPDNDFSYQCLVVSYINLNRFEEARITAQEAKAKGFDMRSKYLIYPLAFLQNDAAGMAQQVALFAGNPGDEDELLSLEADTAAYSGRLRDARDFSRRVMDSAERAEEKETAARYAALSGLREALFGNAEEARRRATLAMERLFGREVQYGAALALAFAGDNGRAQVLIDDLGKRFPEATIVQYNYLPTLRGKLAVNRGNASEAIESLRVANPYDLAKADGSNYWLALYPIYVRGEAYLAAHQSKEAAAEFQKILDHRGIVQNDPIGALVHLQIGRAYAMQGDTAKARAAYQDFLTLWKDADPDTLILIAAKAEYAKLK
jgi:tetratricopeptide (TPR) repeat protein